MKRSLFILAALLLMEVVIASLYLREMDVPERHPDSVSLDWADSWGGAGREYPRSLAHHGGYLYVTGSTSSFGAGKEDVFLLKYSLDGGLIWNTTWGGGGYDMGRAIVATDVGLYVAGITYPDHISKAVLLKYDDDGDLVWAREWGKGAAAKGRGVAVDNDGSIYTAGYIQGVEPGSIKSFLLKYGPDGDLIWERTWGEMGTDYCWALAVDEGVYVGGNTGAIDPLQENADGEPLVVSRMSLTKFDYNGNQIWNRKWGEGIENYGLALMASKGSIYQAGSAEWANGITDTVLLKYDSEGNLRSTCVRSGSYDDYAWGIARGNSYVYVVGHTFSAELYSVRDALLMKCDLDGGLIWSGTWGGIGMDDARSVVVVGDSVYIVGMMYGSEGSGQAFLLKYTSPNASVNPLIVPLLLAVSIAVGLAICLITIREILSYLHLHRT